MDTTWYSLSVSNKDVPTFMKRLPHGEVVDEHEAFTEIFWIDSALIDDLMEMAKEGFVFSGCNGACAGCYGEHVFVAAEGQFAACPAAYEYNRCPAVPVEADGTIHPVRLKRAMEYWELFKKAYPNPLHSP